MPPDVGTHHGNPRMATTLDEKKLADISGLCKFLTTLYSQRRGIASTSV